MTSANPVSWFEIPADNLERATGFYQKVFGWSTPSMGSGAAYALTVAADEQGNSLEAGGINGGFHQRAGETDRAPVVNISVDDIEEALGKIVSAGGMVIQPRTDLPEYELSMALFGDPEGNVLGVYSRLTTHVR